MPVLHETVLTSTEYSGEICKRTPCCTQDPSSKYAMTSKTAPLCQLGFVSKRRTADRKDEILPFILLQTSEKVRTSGCFSFYGCEDRRFVRVKTDSLIYVYAGRAISKRKAIEMPQDIIVAFLVGVG